MKVISESGRGHIN